MRTLPVLLLLVAVILAGAPTTTSARNRSPQVRRLRLDAVRIADLDPASSLQPAAAESTFRALLGAPTVSGGVHEQGISEGYFSLSNPFVGETEAGDVRGVKVLLECEQVYYGPPRDTNAALMGFWAFGFFSLIGKAEHPVLGYVQWRATAVVDDSTFVTAVGEAMLPGNMRTLGRRVALARANRRSLAVLADDLVETLDQTLKLKSRQVGINSKEYQVWVDGTEHP